MCRHGMASKTVPNPGHEAGQVENGVRFAQACILGRLRRQTIFSLAEGSRRDRRGVRSHRRINDHVMRRLGVSHRHLIV